MLGAAQADDQQLIDAVVRSGADIFLSRDAAASIFRWASAVRVCRRPALAAGACPRPGDPSKLLFLDEPTGRWTRRPSCISSSI